MRIDVKIDTRNLKARTLREQKRLAHSTAQSINETVKEVQAEERANLDRKFEIRKAGFMYRLVKVFKFASVRQGRPFAEIGIDPTKKRVLLGTFEEGGVKEPAKGKSVAVPITGEAARPTFEQPVQEELTFRKLRFLRHLTRTGKTQWKGERRTFIIPGLGVLMRGQPVKQTDRAKAFQPRSRSGKFRQAVRETTKAVLLYAFKNRPHLDKVLEFIEIAKKKYETNFKREFEKAFNRKKA